MKLPSMHVILDVVEDMLRESCQKEEEWIRLSMQLYTPDKNDKNNEGWTGEDQLSAFSAFQSAI